jgi:hypothetical protein
MRFDVCISGRAVMLVTLCDPWPGYLRNTKVRGYGISL